MSLTVKNVLILDVHKYYCDGCCGCCTAVGKYFIDNKTIECEIKVNSQSYSYLGCDNFRVNNTYILAVNGSSYNINDRINYDYKYSMDIIIFNTVAIILFLCVFIFLVKKYKINFLLEFNNYFKDGYNELNDSIHNDYNCGDGGDKNKSQIDKNINIKNPIHISTVNQSSQTENTNHDNRKYTSDIENPIHQKEIELELY
jgi:hypothetical protein